jgi:hypothetical protein
MEPTYPENLFSAVAKNILQRRQGLRASESIVKEAEDADPTASFLQKYHYAPGDFANDPTAAAMVNPSRDASRKRIRQYFQEQASMLGGMNAGLAHNQQTAFSNLDQQSNAVKTQKSIANAMAVEAKDPARFSGIADNSGRAQEALNHSLAPTFARIFGGLGGGVLGASLGKSPLKRVGLGLLGAGVGSQAGQSIGRSINEKKTGYQYNDVLKPYEVAARTDRQLGADAIKKQ